MKIPSFLLMKIKKIVVSILRSNSFVVECFSLTLYLQFICTVKIIINILQIYHNLVGKMR